MKVLAAAAVVAWGCGAKPAEPLPAAPRIPLPSHGPLANAQPIHAARPDVSLPDPRPDLSEEPRWPLTMMQHPILEPGFDVARVLADPGIHWTDLCALGAQHRRDPAHHDELDYLGAWCAAEDHDTSAAVTALAALRRSPVPELARAVPFDLASVLVQSEDAEESDQLLSAEGVRDPRIWDLLAAAYFEIGKNEDALYATSTAIQLDSQPLPATRCHRLARQLLLGSEAARPMLLEELRGVANDTHVRDPACENLETTVTCVVRQDCRGYYESQSMTPHEALLATLYDRWSNTRDVAEWIQYAWQIYWLLDVSEALKMLRAALDAAIVSGGCSDHAMRAITHAADTMMPADRVELGTTDHWIHELTDHRDQCRAFRKQWLAANPQ